VISVSSFTGFSGDYNLKFPSGSSGNYLNWPNILTEFTEFSLCLWLRLGNPVPDDPMVLFRYSTNDGNFTLRYENEKFRLTLWTRYGCGFFAVVLLFQL